LLLGKETIPKSLAGAPAAHAAFVEALRDAGFQGEIADDAATRITFATDNSIYQVLPPVVLFPRDGADIHRIVEVSVREAFAGIALTARGGGTGTNGQSLATTIVVDTSRHMNRILDVDPASGRVTVEPGVVLAQLNQRLAADGLFFPPMISTATRATLGGMIGTDACGKGSRRYGRTHDYVESLEVSLASGEALTLQSLDANAIERGVAAGDPAAQLAHELRAAVAPYRDLVTQTFPDMPRSLTGYNLRDAFDDDGSVHLQRLFTGAEGTLGLIRQATLRVIPKPTARRLAVIGYTTFEAALADARALLTTEPSAIETIDDRILALAQQDPGWHRVRHVIEGAPQARVINLVEYEEASESEVATRINGLDAALESSGRAVSDYRVDDATVAAELWAIRARSVGLLARQPGARKPIPFIEDTVVPPDQLPEYIAELRALLDGYGIEYGMFGHVDVGCLHVRPALDMTDAADAALIREITDKVVVLLKRHRGLLWGEHGKGFRGEYTRDFFGETLYSLLTTVKRRFDPHNRMNPGKIVAPDGDPMRIDRIDAVPLRGEHDRQIDPAQRDRWSKAIDCNGNGVCFDWDARQAICPSYKITRDRIHSPKGRAGLVREWLRQGAADANETAVAATCTPRRRRAAVPTDFSHAVYDAMQGCLACKACATQCPVHVDIPDQRSRFLEVYHRRYRRPLRDRLAGALEHLAPVAAELAPLVNAWLASRPGRALTHRLGFADLPAFYRDHGLRRARRAGVRVLDGTSAACLPGEVRQRVVFITPDAFTTYFDPSVLPALCRLLEALALTPVILSYKPSGKALHVHGFRRAFAKLAQAHAWRLEAIAASRRPIVGIDPSTALMYGDEYPRSVAGDIWSRPQLLSTWLATLSLPQRRSALSQRQFRLILHCTERTANPAAADEWREIFERVGLSLDVVETGCCGMAGIYGHQSEHLAHSRGLYDMAWRDAVEAVPAQNLLATGYSCRSQIARQSDRRAAHPVEVLAAHLSANDEHENTKGVARDPEIISTART